MMEDPVVISYEMATKALDAAVELKGPDYVYRPDYTENKNSCSGTYQCHYFDSAGHPSCLVGYVLSMLGLEPFGYASYYNMTGISSLSYSDVGFEFEDDRTRLLLQAAQVQQDTGTPWGEAVENAKVKVKYQ